MPHQPFAQNVAIQAGCGKAFLANRPIFRNLIPASVPYELLNPKLQASRTWLWGFAPSGCAACPPFTSRSKPLEARGADAYGSKDYLPRKTCCPIKLCMRKSSYPLPQQILSSAALNICIISTPADGYNQGCRSCCCMVRHLTRGPPPARITGAWRYWLRCDPTLRASHLSGPGLSSLTVEISLPACHNSSW